MSNLFSIFNLSPWASVEWSTDAPAYQDRVANREQVAPEYICQFISQNEQYRLGYYAMFHSHEGLPYVDIYATRYVGDHWNVARAIAELRCLEHYDYPHILPEASIHLYTEPDSDDAYPLERIITASSIVDTLSMATIAAYTNCDNLKKSFPRLAALASKDASQGGYVYVLSNQLGHYKIGKADVLDRRILQVSIQMPFKVEFVEAVWVPKPLKVESYLHSKYSNVRMNGEWFALSESDLSSLTEWMRTETEMCDRVSMGLERDWSNWRLDDAGLSRWFDTVIEDEIQEMTISEQ